MKNLKIYSIVITIVVIILLVILGISYFFKGNISRDEALNIAYNYVGVTESDVTIKSIDKDYEDGEYEIEFYTSDYKYEIDIDYSTGNINNFEKDAINTDVTITSTSVDMTGTRAKEIAISYVGLDEADVTFTKIKLAKSDGVTVYKVYFYSDSVEYEIYINVETEEVVKYSEEVINTTTTTTDTNYIGIENAKLFALKHAGLTGESVIWHEAKLDIEYGIATYEIEFYYNNYKYEYEINATTGDVISYEKDRY